MDKLLNIYKPKGMTSHDIVDKVRHKYPDEKVGHGGTLDPMAEGVLILGVGKATKRLLEISDMDKSYEAKIALGVGSKTDDLDTDEVLTIDKDMPELNKSLIKKALKDFKGKIEQRVPLYSATHYQGVKLYKRARSGEEIPYEKLPKKLVEISKLKLIKFNKEDFSYKGRKFPTIKLKIDCSSGTYIRSIARDLGTKLKTKGILISLTRTRVGRYLITDSKRIEDIF